MNSRAWIAVVLSWAIVVLVSLEVLLRFGDPGGFYQYRRVLHWNYSHRVEHETGYSLLSGSYPRAPGGAVTILEDGSRLVPNSVGRDSACTVVLIGDSVAFGMGVSDDDTYINALAGEFDSVHWINAARPGYNSTNLSRLYRSYPADGYIYHVVSNDAQMPTAVFVVGSMPSALLYRWNLHTADNVDLEAPEDWHLYGGALLDMPRGVLVFGRDAPVTRFVSAYMPTVIVPHWGYSISTADGHPDARGHEVIASQLMRHVELWLSMVCDEP